jgi:hypothetical protein
MKTSLTAFHTKPRKQMARTPFKKTYTPLKRTRTKASKKRSKNGIWSTATADMYFSRYIRERDGRCLKCGTKDNLTCSHFWRRGHSGTRFDPLNCIALCGGANGCHQDWEDKKNHEYKAFMITLLMPAGYESLEKRARSFKERRQAVAEFKAFYDSLQ